MFTWGPFTQPHTLWPGSPISGSFWWRAGLFDTKGGGGLPTDLSLWFHLIFIIMQENHLDFCGNDILYSQGVQKQRRWKKQCSCKKGSLESWSHISGLQNLVKLVFELVLFSFSNSTLTFISVLIIEWTLRETRKKTCSLAIHGWLTTKLIRCTGRTETNWTRFVRPVIC